ncbi:MAG: hypothetical protein JSS94_07840 [Bacteroidetes bacterium]|nr:hypothetical protein [Bacteroidota bacterium]
MLDLKIIKKYIIDSQIYVSLMGSFLASFFMLEQNTFRFPSFFLIFFTYFGGYIYTKYQYSKRMMQILFLCAIAGIICAVLIIQNHNIERLYKWMVICLLGLLYNSYFLKINVRKIPLFKIFYVGFIWGLMDAWLSLQEFHWSIFGVSFLFITALVLPFDIRDMKNETVLIFPNMIGVRNTKILAAILLIASGFIAYFYLQPIFALAFILSILCTLPFVFYSKNSLPDAYFSFGVESCSAFPLLFYVLLRIISY